MATTPSLTQPHAVYSEQVQDMRQVISPATLTYSQVAQGSPQYPQVPSPASTESLLSRTMEEYNSSLPGPAPPYLNATPPPVYQIRACPLRRMTFSSNSQLYWRGVSLIQPPKSPETLNPITPT